MEPRRPLSLYANARKAFRVGLPFPPISRHAATVEGPSWFQVFAPARVFSMDCMKRPSFSESIAHGRVETFSLYMVMNCSFVMVLLFGDFPRAGLSLGKARGGKDSPQWTPIAIATPRNFSDPHA
jgi:hypothetical protein